MGIFDPVVLRTNVRKTSGVVCIPCQAAGVRVYKAYTRRITVEGMRFKERERERHQEQQRERERERERQITS